MQLTARDLQRLQGVHPDLVRVVTRVAQVSPIRFVVLEGLRTHERQVQLLRERRTTTPNSRHLTGHAVDLAPLADLDGDSDVESNEISWRWHDYFRLAPIVKSVALELRVPLEWGGDWREFKDGPHWQLPWKAYPAQGDAR